jgi:hypothetical protein
MKFECIIKNIMHVTFNPPHVLFNLITHRQVPDPEIHGEYCQQNSLAMLTSKALCTFHF